MAVAEKINEMVQKAKAAVAEYKKLNQEQTDAICEAIAKVIDAKKEELAQDAVTETRLGKVADKTIKNYFGSTVIWNDMKGVKTVGVIKDENNIIEIAEPVGVIAGVCPTTNPTSTVAFKVLSALKCRNAIIFGFHPRAQKCCEKTAQLCLDAAIKAGAPKDCIQWITEPSVEATNALMTNPGVDVILATGGGAMVRAAYSSGNPAFGVGAGGCPVYVAADADIDQAMSDTVLSKNFDHGVVCASEQNLIFDNPQTAEKAIAKLKELKTYVCNDDEKKKLEALYFDHYVVNGAVVGLHAAKIAEMAGFSVPADTEVLLVGPLKGLQDVEPMCREKLSPTLGYYIVDGKDAAIDLCEKLLQGGGAGHTAGIHSSNEATCLQFAQTVDANRVTFNSPTSHGAIGGLYNVLIPSLTLGCGSRGKNITSDNVSFRNLVNIKRAARRVVQG
ncbi:aldehyde dehydrogenase family protein [Pelobacter propionicus]|uniref:Aldehyde dehydrogenase n=1 Tax=Pelobacter propionicus (strain DSM 2379 / NBRC 103807 / OttBd1) TaxID=338966 RepID=A1AQB3_PELPD|nr:aldehyde dehydrogenase family protein [Pelobacter propionicus]ABK99533.1 aldehyde dehydrogenase [Pelobacter propionicus DSM 2379]